ncbi:MAG: electron transport complex subunit RsxC [Lachnospiraceae bacterium]|nr:electron transport complex subunit RsxC [Lachnospiraceae bacterium]
MARDTFSGGVHPAEHKEFSRGEPLKIYETKGDVILPLSQHIGRPAKPVVKKNDPVLAGQIVAEADGFVSANIICSVSGKVKAVEKRRTLTGAMQDCIVIENDGQFTPVRDYEERDDIAQITNEEILARIVNAGIVGLGGAGFPTHVKLAPKDPVAIKYVIVNGAECEPYLTCDDQLMRARCDEIVEGLEIILKLFVNAEGVIGIERNKPEAIAAMERAADGHRRVRIQPLKTKYPQGGEKSLIRVIAGIDTPRAMLPADVGCIVINVGTVFHIQRAVVHNEPLFRRAMTVTGDAVKEPGNFIVRTGTLFSEVLEAAGGIKEGVTLKKALAGGPMMGIAIANLDVPVIRMNNGLTLFSEDAVEKAEKQMTACLHCGRCTTVCPIGLMPQMMADAFIAQDLERYEKKLYGLECVECGSCTYICPAKRPLMQTFKQAKAEIAAVKAAKAAGGAR